MKLISRQLPVTAPSVGRTKRTSLLEYAYEFTNIHQLKQLMYIASADLNEGLFRLQYIFVLRTRF